MKPIIAISAGDTNGIGYEVILKTLHESHILEICIPVVYGNANTANLHAETLGQDYNSIKWNIITSPKEAKEDRCNLINCYEDNMPVVFGKPSKEAGQAAYSCLERACRDMKAGLADALVTAPINKDNIQSEQFKFDGHTEYLTSYFADEEHKESVMMLVGDSMRVALVCNHTPISKVAEAITKERIISKLDILNKSLKEDFTIRRPRIAVLALNPHAGDNGLLGKEENDIITPAIEQAYEQGIYAFGPYSADGFFGSGMYQHFDAILAMYHDQGLIPFKSMSMSGVNYTAGLPIVRTSPDHGTAYDIAGQNKADKESFTHAIYMALDILQNRKMNKELLANPLAIKERVERDNGERTRPPFLGFKTDTPAEEKGESGNTNSDNVTDNDNETNNI